VQTQSDIWVGRLRNQIAQQNTGSRVDKMKIKDAPNLIAFVKIYVVSYLNPLNRRHIKSLAVPKHRSNLSLRFAAIIDFFLLRTSSILRSSLIVSPDLENMDIAVGISFTSCIDVEICVISYLLPVNGSYL